MEESSKSDAGADGEILNLGKPELLAELAGHFSAGIDDLPAEALAELGEALDGGGLLRSELVGFWNVLEDGLGRAGYQRPTGQEVRLLNLACGPCFEGAVLASFFGRPGAVGGARNRVRFFGMDLRGREIDEAKRRYAATEEVFRKLGFPPISEGAGENEQASGAEFFADDATRLVGYREIPKEFDMIFLRHQNVWNDRPVWGRIFGFALDRLAEGGLMVITSYFDREHAIALDLIKRLGGELLVTVGNPATRVLDTPGKSTDRHLAVFRARGTEGE